MMIIKYTGTSLKIKHSTYLILNYMKFLYVHCARHMCKTNTSGALQPHESLLARYYSTEISPTHTTAITLHQFDIQVTVYQNKFF